MIDKREWRRVEVKLAAECSCQNLPNEKFKVRVIDINETGFCFAAPASVSPCHKLFVTLDLKGEGSARLEVKTVWSGYFEKPGEYRAGVKISQADPEDLKKYLRFYHLQVSRVFPRKTGEDSRSAGRECA